MAASAIPVPADSSSAVASFDAVVIMATRLEALLELLGRRRALARTIQIREHAAQRLGHWSHAHVLDALATVDRLQDGERFAEAVDSARRLLYLAQQAGETAYAGAPYDVALCVFQLGRALLRGDHADAGLASLAEAAQRFVCLSEAGNASATRMISVCVAERANGLWKLGRFDDAARRSLRLFVLPRSAATADTSRLVCSSWVKCNHRRDSTRRRSARSTPRERRLLNSTRRKWSGTCGTRLVLCTGNLAITPPQKTPTSGHWQSRFNPAIVRERLWRAPSWAISRRRQNGLKTLSISTAKPRRFMPSQLLPIWPWRVEYATTPLR
jgi:hypothetical protein